MGPERIRTLRGKRGKQGGGPVLRGLLKNAHSARIVPRKLGPGTPQAQFRSLSSLSIAPQHLLSRLLHSHPQNKEPVWRGSAGDLSILEYRNIQMEHVESKSGFLGLPGAMGPPRHPKQRNHNTPRSQPAPIRRAPFATEMRRTPPV